MKRIFLVLVIAILSANTVHAQYWCVWKHTNGIVLGLSSDEKWAFFLQKNDAGVQNIYKVELKTNFVTPVTNFTERPVISGIVIFGKPAIIYLRAASNTGSDVHVYRVDVLGTDPPIDITPKDEISSKKILGLAYNGRYVYYTSDKGPGTKKDTWRYDCQQYILELAFTNDKDYETLCWSRDQTHLLLRDPNTREIFSHDIETTDNVQVQIPIDATKIQTAFYGPMNTTMLMLTNGSVITAKMSSPTAVDPIDNIEAASKFKDVTGVELSLNGKYTHLVFADPKNFHEKIIETASGVELALNPDPNPVDLVIGPKESSVLYMGSSKELRKGIANNSLYLYDFVKKTTKELTLIK
ncbi:MAG: hypothetical protein WCH46_06865 [bacterium]